MVLHREVIIHISVPEGTGLYQILHETAKSMLSNVTLPDDFNLLSLRVYDNGNLTIFHKDFVDGLREEIAIAKGD